MTAVVIAPGGNHEGATMRVQAILILLAVFCATAAHAEPYEFIACNFYKGKGLVDVEKWAADNKATLDSTQDGYRAVVL